MKGWTVAGVYYCQTCYREMDPDTRRNVRTEGDIVDEDAWGGPCVQCGGTVGVENTGPKKYLTAIANAPYGLTHIEAALGFGGRVLSIHIRRAGTTGVVVEAPAEHAVWNSRRLASCLYGGQIYDTQEQAEEAVKAVVNLR